MIPLASAAGKPEGSLSENLASALREITVEDAVDFYRAFDLAGARVADVDEYSLKDARATERLRQEGRTLLDLMKISEGHDLIAREWSTGYERSFRLAARLMELIEECGLNEGIVRAFLEALAEEPDSLIAAKFGAKKAKEVSSRACIALKDKTLDAACRLDEELLSEDVNPGSTADLIAAALFISLLKGIRF
jgi:triphosphoribosyl-dephospho-CoA synthase